MRSAHRIQPALPLGTVPHKHARQLVYIAHILEQLPELERQVLDDLAPPSVRRDVGRTGLSAQQVLRILVLYILLKVDFEQLEFHLQDSQTYRTFCLLGLGEAAPKRACLQENLSRLRPETLQALHKILVERAVSLGVESGHAVRIDTTPVLAPIRAPLDSALLGDAVRVLLRLLRRAQKWVPMSVPSHQRRVRRRTTALRAEKLPEEERAALYFDLLQDTKRYVESAITLTIENDYVTAIEGAGLDAQLMRSYIEAWGDREAYAVSHVGYGLCDGARWDSMALYDKRDFNGTELRAFAGNFLYSTGANEVAGRYTLGHFDLPMRHCTVMLDGATVVDNGRVVD